MVDIVTRLGAACLAVTFAWAAVNKVLRWPTWSTALQAYGLPEPVRAIATVVVPLSELACVGLLVGGFVSAGAALALGMLTLFSAALLRARSLQGDRLPCGCFGRSKERDYRSLLARNAALAVSAILVLLGGSGTGASLELAPTDLIPATLVCAGFSLIGWMLMSVNGELRKKGSR